MVNKGCLKKNNSKKPEYPSKIQLAYSGLICILKSAHLSKYWLFNRLLVEIYVNAKIH